MPDPIVNSAAPNQIPPQSPVGMAQNGPPNPAVQTTPDGMGQPPIAQQPMQNAPTPSQPMVSIPASAAPHLSKMAAIGQAFHHMASGSTTQYLPTGPGGSPVATQVPDKPGQLFRSILAGALAGMGAGAEAKMGGGIGSFAVGASAGIKNQQQQQQQRQQQGQQEFENTQKAQSQASEETYRKAMTAQANQATLKDAFEVLGQSLAQHDQLATNDKPELSGYIAARIKPDPKYTDLPETEALKLEHTPGFTSNLRWLVTGTIPVRDADGKIVSYQNTYSGYPPTAEMPLTPAILDGWKKNGILEANPNLMTSSIVQKKPDGSYTIDYKDFRALDAQNDQLQQRRLAAEKQVNDAQEVQDKHELMVAQTKAEDARRVAEQTTSGLAAFNQKEKVAAESAEKKYQEKGWDALTPDERYYAQGAVRENIATQEKILDSRELKVDENSDDPSVKAAAFKKAHDAQLIIENESQKLLGPVTPPPPPPPPENAPSTLLLGKMQQDDHIQPGTPQAYKYIINSNLKPEDQQAALRDSKTPIPWIEATDSAEQLIAKTPMSREEALKRVIQQAESKGLTVSPKPDNGSVMSPYPNLSSANVTLPTTK